MSEWPTKTLGEICREGDGFIRTGPFGSQLHRSDYTDDPNGIPVVMPKDMARGRIDTASIARIDDETADRLKHHLLSANDVVLARRGDVGRTAWVFEEDLPAFCGTGSMRVHPGRSETVRPSFLRFFFHTKLASDYLEGHAVGATMPNLNAGIVESLPVPIPPLPIQDSLIAVLEAFDELIENNRRRVEALEEMARAIYREWFVKFRYPGHEGVALVDSALGPIPLNWEVVPLVSVASETGSGPFGSKLGRKDYQPHGVPVIRGANLRVGGGFDERGFAFVSPAKADELRSSWALRGDILVTQRGTLGQVGMIPAGSQFDLYVLSQSQMKVTLERGRAAGEFVYAQLCSDSTVQRFVSRAMTAGVPHVNLRLLREFEILLPPRSLQGRFAEVAAPLMDLAFRLEREQLALARLRDALLPKLVTGQIDVSTLDLDALVSTGSTAVEFNSIAEGVGVA